MNNFPGLLSLAWRKMELPVESRVSCVKLKTLSGGVSPVRNPLQVFFEVCMLEESRHFFVLRNEKRQKSFHSYLRVHPFERLRQHCCWFQGDADVHSLKYEFKVITTHKSRSHCCYVCSTTQVLSSTAVRAYFVNYCYFLNSENYRSHRIRAKSCLFWCENFHLELTRLTRADLPAPCLSHR